MGKPCWPPWLEPLLRTRFFLPCKTHNTNSTRSECNMYCLDCNNGAQCSFCLAYHRDHRVIQIRRSSYHDVIRVSEIRNHLDISGVQTYVINGAGIVFLNERPQLRSGKVSPNMCCNCNRSLLDAFDFCSLGCKLAKTTTSSSSKEADMDETKGGTSWKQLEESSESTRGERDGIASPGAKKKRRKGIPRRAPR